MNRFDKRIGITPEKISEASSEIVASHPIGERTVVPAVNRGVPFMLGDSHGLWRSSFLIEVIRQRSSQLDAKDGGAEPVRQSVGRGKRTT
jgi:hypothetical protein